MDSTLNPTQKTHIVWLDVVRLVAMFTVVCCHSADPFNFYPGEPPGQYCGNQVVGCRVRFIASSVCTFVCDDYRSLAVAGKRGDGSVLS